MLLRAFLLLFIALPALGQDRIAIKVANDVPIVPVRVNGCALLFVLDTGSERPAIDAPLVAALNLKTVGDVKVLRNYRVFETTEVEARAMEVGNHKFPQPILTVADMKPASRALDVDMDGILGNDVLEG